MALLAALFPIALVLIGAFVLMNLFLGILLGNFTYDMKEEKTTLLWMKMRKPTRTRRSRVLR